MKRLIYSIITIVGISGMSLAQTPPTTTFFENFSIEFDGKTYTFPNTLDTIQDESYSGYAYPHTTYGDYVETIFWKSPQDDGVAWLPTENGFLELSLDYREIGENTSPEYVVGFSFSKDTNNPYPSGERIHGYLTGPSLENLTGVLRNWDHGSLGFYGDVPTTLNLSQYLTEEGKTFFSNTNNYINSGGTRGVLVTEWPGTNTGGGSVIIDQAQELNIGLEFDNGQWVPAQ
jgi:hypothetical protein